MSLKLRLLISSIVLLIFTITVLMLTTIQSARELSTETLTDLAKARLVNQNVQTKSALESYLSTIESQIRSKANNVSIKEIATDFIDAFNNYSLERLPLSAEDKDTLASYYHDEFSKQYTQANNKTLPNLTSLYNKLSEISELLQYDFIANPTYGLGEKDKLISLNNNTAYSALHEKHHPSLRFFLQEFGYYDIFIADANTGYIVYSVFKELDFATNLRNGPYSTSGIGKAFNAALNSNSNMVYFSDIQPYLPSYDALAGFISTPIYSNGNIIAVLIFQMPMDHIGNLLIHNKEWLERGFGASGETYLVNASGLLLNESRFFVEDFENYKKAISLKYPDIIRHIERKNTSIGIQPVESPSVKEALNGQSGFKLIKDYRDVPVFSAYSPVNIGNHKFALMAEIDEAEALAPAYNLAQDLTQNAILVACVIAIIAIASVLYLSSLMIKPLRNLGNTFSELSEGRGDLTVKVSVSGIPEIDRISNGFNDFITHIHHIIKQVQQKAYTAASASEKLTSVTDESSRLTTEQSEQIHSVIQALSDLNTSVDAVKNTTEDTRQQSLVAHENLLENRKRANAASDNIHLLVSLISDSSEVIGGLKSEVEKITGMLNVITSISDQTNLLALNAAIEAARAGDAGRGFSVVADEVRALATRSQESANEISKLVDIMTTSSDKSVERMERAAVSADGGIHLVDLVTKAMDELAENIDRVAAMADTVTESTNAERQLLKNLVGNIDVIKTMSSEVNRGTQHTADISKELSQIAEESHQLIQGFKL
ncbi:methyl-accepting chemotaxis protein [Marinibactrum halimedae]|uniref:Methyl-accepting chemotaxis protein n=1 Tax=Marinibactrum halimedae TaxID=1444977 RepID=A0AA37WNS8_9GAMM|nr:methyl-accepting chemotaxis protein [Marinibactrum halimedae]MCD9460512.1 methyl-accepting chemotaxis protein [Marinibactrum halimedae]GLS27875.1 methyl-accepting chemotaxis protein [Marinibactrum halimedae]